MTTDRNRTYRLEPLDTSGLFLGLGAVQCGLLGAGLTLAVAGISIGLPLVGAVAPVVASAVLSFARVGGHPAWEWLPLGVGWAWRELAWGRRWAAPLPLWPTDADKPPPLPPCLAGLELVDVAWHEDRTLGCVRDTERHTLTAVVPVRAGSFIVERTAEQERLLAGWGDVLGQFAGDGGVVTNVAWSELTRPSGLDHHVAWLASLDRDGRRGPARATGSYDELVDLARTTSTAHDAVVAVTVARDHLRRRHDLGGDNPAAHLQRALGTAVDGLLRSLRSAGLHPARPLDTRGLQRLLRTRIDPTARALSRARGRLADRLGLVVAASAGPLVVETSWRHVRIDASWHRTYWIACWPRIEVPASWLEPFMAGGVTRAVTVVFAPVPTHQSRRRIERDLVKLESDAATKEDQGRRVDARHRRATETLLEREQELVAGYPEMAYVGLVTVTGRSGDELEEQCEIVEQLARESRMELRVVDGRQDVAWAAALPFGLAPRSLLAT